MITIRELAEALQAARIAAKSAALALAEKQLAFEMENLSLIQNKAEAEKRLADADGALRAFALVKYEATGNKRPGPGVEILMTTHLNYDHAQALAWAMEKKLACSLDKRVFVELAKILELDFVRISAEPTVTVAQDLAKALEREETP